VKSPLKALRTLLEEAKSSQALGRPAISLALFHLFRRLPFARRWLFAFNYHGLPFRARGADYWAVEEVLLFNGYQFVLPLLMGIVEPPLIVDAGANIGTFGLFMLAARADAVMHSVEPSQATYDVLRQNAQGKPNWHVHRVALWRENGTVMFENHETSVEGHIAYGDQPQGTLEQVPARRLDTFLAESGLEHIHILKLDIEGAAEAVLNEAHDVLRCVDHLILEVHPPYEDSVRLMALLAPYFPHVVKVEDEATPYHILVASKTPLPVA